MIILELRAQSLVLKEYTLEKGDSLTIGRHPTMTLYPKMQLSLTTMRLLKEKEKNSLSWIKKAETAPL